MELQLKPKVREAWDAVMAWDGSTPIYNPEYEEHKRRLSRAFEDRQGATNKPDIPRDNGSARMGFFYDLLFRAVPLVMLHKSKIPAEVKAYEAAEDEKALQAWMLDFYETWRPISERLAAMKPKAIPGRRPSAETVERERLRSLPANQGGLAMIASKITEITREWRTEEIARVVEQFTRLVSTYSTQKQEGETPATFWRRHHRCRQEDRPANATRTHSAAMELEAYDRRRELAAHDAAIVTQCLADDAFAQRTAERHADDVIATFTAKMQDKLAFAVADLDSIEARNVSRAQRTLDCTLDVTLKGSGQFSVRNQIVGSYSALGTHFYRFPSTFHDVVVPNFAGRIAMASEEEMIALFAPQTVRGAVADRAPAIAQNARARLR